jgi:AcrR family transcriptional regulator
MVTSTPNRRKQQERRDDAETKLLATAATLIARQGWIRTTLAQIGEEAGYSRGLVNHHFGSKVALVERLARLVQEDFFNRVLAGPDADGLATLLRAADSYLADLAHPTAERQAFLVMWAESVGVGRELRPTFVSGDRRFHSSVRRVVKSGQSDGSIRLDVDPDAFAWSFVGELRGISLLTLGDHDGLDLDGIRADTRASLRRRLAA